jgi:hypothetical protein
VERSGALGPARPAEGHELPRPGYVRASPKHIITEPLDAVENPGVRALEQAGGEPGPVAEQVDDLVGRVEPAPTAITRRARSSSRKERARPGRPTAMSRVVVIAALPG